MIHETPDRWCILTLTAEDGKVYTKLFAMYYGSYLHGESWRLNSGITGITKNEDGNYVIRGRSGSVYICSSKGYGITAYGRGVVDAWSAWRRAEVIKVLPEDTDWLSLPVHSASGVGAPTQTLETE